MRMQYKTVRGLEKPECDTAVFLFEKTGGLAARPDLAGLGGFLEPILKNGEFKGGYLDELPLRVDDKNGARWIFMVGLGAADKLGPARILEAAAKAVKMSRSRAGKTLALALPPLGHYAPEHVLELMALGSSLALYQQTEFKSKPENGPELKTLYFLAGPESAQAQGDKKILDRAAVLAKNVNLARDLGNQPGNACYPESLAAKAKEIGQAFKMKVTIWDEHEAAKEKLGAFLAVGQGSHHPPRMVTLRYQGGPAGQKPVVLIGKGVTFDSGGLCVKPAEGMNTMKTDMGGAAAALAAIAAAAEMKLPVNLAAILPLAENMPGGGAYRPGDVLRSRSGQTIEVINTDAEGRLVLADALTLAQEMEPEMVIDLATLTGACVVALGENCAGLFTNRRELRSKLMDAAEAVGENFWPLPLLDEYEESLKSETADFAHAASRSGGAINAALFLRKFIKPETPWLHLDIAGPARAGKASPSTPVGASGFAVRTLLKFLEG